MAGQAGKGAGKQSGAGQRGGRPNVIIRREEIIEGGHHGGAWKVAYADFVTAMMAFFLLMWLINATTQDQRRGIAAYFSPMAKVENGFSGSGMIPGGAAPVADGAQLVNQGPAQLATLAAHGDTSKTDSDGEPDSGNASTKSPDTAVASLIPISSNGADLAPVMPSDAQSAEDGADGAQGRKGRAIVEEKLLENTAERLRNAVAHDPALAGVAGQMAIDVTPDGLRIQIMDAAHQPMFDRGSIVPNKRAAALLSVAARYIKGLPESVSIGGHTDGSVYRNGEPSNWSLSSGRADAARDVLVAAGLPDARLSDVIGYADRKLLLPADPLAPANRRIVLTLQRAWPQSQAQAQAQAEAQSQPLPQPQLHAQAAPSASKPGKK